MPIASRKGGGVVDLSHDLCFILKKIKHFFFVCSEIEVVHFQVLGPGIVILTMNLVELDTAI